MKKLKMGAATAPDPKREAVGYVALALVVGGVVYGLASVTGIVTGFQRDTVGDHVTHAEAHDRNTRWEAVPKPLKLSPAPASAADTMGLISAAEQRAIKDALAQGRVRLAFFTVQDDGDPDGDKIRIESAGYRVDVVLGASPQRLALPVPPGGGVVTVQGYDDKNGGGLTAKVEGNSLPLLQAWQTVNIPVVVKQ